MKKNRECVGFDYRGQRLQQFGREEAKQEKFRNLDFTDLPPEFLADRTDPDETPDAAVVTLNDPVFFELTADDEDSEDKDL